MLPPTLRSQINKVWNAFWNGGLSNPLTVIEQMTYLLFIKRLDEIHTQREQKANFLKTPIENPIFKPEEYQLRRSRFKDTDPEVMFSLFRREGGVFDFMVSLGNGNTSYKKFMKGATFLIPTPRLLAQVEQVYSDQPLGKFVRSIVDLDVTEARSTFAELLNNVTFNSQQIRFIDKIINFLTVNGTIDPGMLFETPFTDINSKGLAGLFDGSVSREIIWVIERINGNVVAA